MLPAEYGIDPLKTGALLHLTDLAKATESKPEAKPATGARPMAAAAGSFTAPIAGIHGWFWENKGKKQVDIHLTTAGFCDSAKMYAGEKPDELTIQDVK